MFEAMEYSQHASCQWGFRDPKTTFPLSCLCPFRSQLTVFLPIQSSLEENERERERKEKNVVGLL